MTLTHRLRSILAYALLSTNVVCAADYQASMNDKQAKTLESIRPQVVSLKQSLSVITRWLENSPSINKTSVTDLSETATYDQLNDVLSIALEYVLDKQKSKSVKKIHKVSGKATTEEGMSVYSALLDMCKMIDDMQNKLYATFGVDNRPKSIGLRKQLQGVVKFDALVAQKPRSMSKAEIMALDFIRTKSIEFHSSSSSSSPESSPPNTPLRSDSPKPFSSPYSSPVLSRPRPDSNGVSHMAYADTKSLADSPVFQRMRASSSGQIKKQDNPK